MATAGTHFELAAMQAEKRRVALNSIYAALVITGLKIVVGLSTRSLGILSEAAHSGLDLIAAFVTFASVRVADKPADADHQYGHGKVENFSAFIETGLLLLTCVWIVWEAVRRLFFAEVHLTPSVAAFAVMALSMAIDTWRSRRLSRIAKKYGSQALEADALHFSTDVWSSAVVIAGLAAVAVGEKYGKTWLIKADPIAALVVACIVVYVSWQLARRTIDALLDAAPGGIRASIIEQVRSVPGVLEVGRVRIRRAGNHYFADLAVGLGRNVTFQRSEQVAEEVTNAVHALLPNSDVVVHSVPFSSGEENVFEKIRAVALRHNLGVHDVSVQEKDGHIHVEQHLELDEKLTLKQAHDMVTEIEAEMRSEAPEISSILTHIESEPATIEAVDEILRSDGDIEARLRKAAAAFPEIIDVHDVAVRRVRGLVYLSCHCTMADNLALGKVHDVITALETRIKQDEPELFKVLIHPEPQTDNRR